jgi:hypothetical protein
LIQCQTAQVLWHRSLPLAHIICCYGSNAAPTYMFYMVKNERKTLILLLKFLLSIAVSLLCRISCLKHVSTLFLFFFLVVLGLELDLHLESLHWPFFGRDFLRQVLRTICPGWFWTSVLLISASWVARIPGVSHWHTAVSLFLKTVWWEVHFSCRKRHCVCRIEEGHGYF